LINAQHRSTPSAGEVSGRRLTTVEAATRLGVKPATLYAYVSRGLLTRERSPRGSSFDAGEVERLAAGARRPATRPGRPLTFVTELTLIDGGVLRYRGLDAARLSRTRRFEDVAGWLWTGGWGVTDAWSADPDVASVVRRTGAALPAGAVPADRLRVAVAAAATADPRRQDTLAPAVAATAARILAALVDGLPLLPRRTDRVPTDRDPLAARLWPRLSPLPATAPRVAVLDAALVLLADHEMAASTLAARTAAAVGADPYAVVGAGLGAASGPYHAASSAEVLPVLARAEQAGAAVAVGEALGRHGPLHGFGHPLYPDGDPRATELLHRLDAERDHSAAPDAVDAVLDLTWRGMPAPNIDFALAALAHRTRMIDGASEAIFLVARTAGWLAHAIEEYAERTSFRIRATYVGPTPSPSSEPATDPPATPADPTPAPGPT
jgi:citrate synthase